MIRILLIEDLALVRESLAMAFGTVSDMELWGCPVIQDGINLLTEAAGRFDLVLVKQVAGGPTVDELLAIANLNGLRGRVLVITPGLSDREQKRLEGIGVAGIFAQQRSLADLVGAVREVAMGQAWLGGQPSRDEPLHKLLSPQERRAAELVWEGLANKEIAVRMAVSESCVKALLQRVFLKVGVRTRGQLVRALMERALGAPSERPPGARVATNFVDLAGHMNHVEPLQPGGAPFEAS